MEYRIEHKEGQRFLALVRDFSNEESLDSNGRSIPDLWTECGERGRTESLLSLRPQGKRDLYGLCGPVKDSETHFTYGIGILLDGDTDQEAAEKLVSDDCVIWQTEPEDYAVFQCFGPDGDCLGEAWDRFFKEFSPQTGYAQTDSTDYELYFEHPPEGLFCELWVPVVKQ